MAPKVFISYSHQDEAWKDRLQAQLAVLEMEGLLSVWEDRRIEAGDAWYPEIERALDTADVAILLISAAFLSSRFIRGEEVPRLLERREREGVRVIPLVLKPCPWRKVDWLSALQGATRDNVELSGLSEHHQDAALCRLAEHVHELLQANRPTSGWMPDPGHRPPILIDRLPTVEGEFFGREVELNLLDAALAGDGTRIIQFVAAGGTGKTKLLRHWLNRHLDDLPGRIVWSFYSQGTSEERQVSASPLFDEGLRAFGIDPLQFRTEEERADAFADRLAGRGCLLVLDGLEPLQHGGTGMDGRLKERAVARLLKGLAQRPDTLCIVTTRIPVHELADQPRVTRRDLDNLAPADGVRLLRSLGVAGAESCLQAAVTEVEGHALTLHLLGNAVATYLEGDIRKRDTLPALIDDYGHPGRHAFKVMQAYEHWLSDERGEPLAELRLLYLLGLFDHPVEVEVLEVLWREAIPGLTEGVPLPAWQAALRHLRECHRLLSRHPGRPGLLDCHPLIREWFGGRLRERWPEAWRRAQERLYDHYRGLPKKERPDTLEELRPLLSAVAHGCAAGLHQRVFHEVYWPRIQRKQEAYLVHKLGAFSDDLAAVAHLFAPPWRSPAAGLGEEAQAVVLNWAGFDLRALGRLREALEPMGANVEGFAKAEEWKSAAISAGNLSELQLTLGEVAQALRSGLDGVAHADRSGDPFQRMINRTTHADALHQAGEAEAARARFQEAERLQREHQPAYPRLYSLPGFRYCDLLLAQGGDEAQGIGEVLERHAQWVEWRQESDSLLDRSLEHLTLGRAHLRQALAARGGGGAADPQALRQAAHRLDQAVAGLREAGTLHNLPWGLLSRAALHRHTGDFPRAHRDLQEVHDLAEPGGMRLHLTDYHLESARLALAEHDADEARHHTDAAARLIEATGYRRRLPELQELTGP